MDNWEAFTKAVENGATVIVSAATAQRLREALVSRPDLEVLMKDKIQVSPHCPDEQVVAVFETRQQVSPGFESKVVEMGTPNLDGPPCLDCGGITQQTGTCHTCVECGSTTGCG